MNKIIRLVKVFKNVFSGAARIRGFGSKIQRILWMALTKKVLSITILRFFFDT